MTVTAWTLPRESVEFVPLVVTKDAVPVTGGAYEVQVVPQGARPDPDTWAAPLQVDTEYGVLVDGLDPGTYRVWVRITSNPETPVLDDAGILRIT